MTTEAATPQADTLAPASGQPAADTPAINAADGYAKPGLDESGTGQAAAAAEGEQAPAKPARTLEQLQADLDAQTRINRRLQRGIDRRTAMLADERAQRQLTTPAQGTDNRPAADDSETVSLTKAELTQRIRDEAARLAPTMREQAAEVERRQGVIQSLEKSWGKEKFDTLASDLEDAFGTLTDRSGKPIAALEAVFEADAPAQVIEYLADPDNADEAERISKLGAVQAGKAIARLEDSLKAKAALAKPQPSNAPAPLEAIRSTGRTSNGAPDPSNVKAWTRWANEQERKGLAH